MLRRFGFGRSSSLDVILAKPQVKLEELFEDSDQLLQEVHLQNPRLISFLRQPSVLSQLRTYHSPQSSSPSLLNKTTKTTTTPTTKSENLNGNHSKKNEGNNNKKNNHVYIACEILAAGIPALMDGLVYAHPELLTVLWAILDQPCKLTPRQMAGFCKVNAILLQRRTGDLVRFIESHKDIVVKWLNHIFNYEGAGVPYLSDLLIAFVQCERLPEGTGIGQWLADHGLLTLLVDRMQPHLDPLNHEIAQQMLCDIIFSSDTSSAMITELTSLVTMKRLAGYMLDSTAPHASNALICGTGVIRGLRQYSEKIISNSMVDPTMLFCHALETFTERIGDLMALLDSPRSCKEAEKDERLGLERLSICELLMEFLYCASVATGEKGAKLANAYRRAVIEHKALIRCLDLFFAFPSNNILHNTVYALMRDILLREPPRPVVLTKDHLVIEVLVRGRLMERMLDAYDAVRQQGKTRPGYMGHLALLSNDIQRALEEIYHPELAEYLEHNDASAQGGMLLTRWFAHYEQLGQEIKQKMSFNNEAVFWSVSRYQELMDETTARIYDAPEVTTRQKKQ
ncbi:SIT4 phosphatase-associated protein-domain-containing protein [Zychaea mexicana]|uniref:SIT4 phosphatase-associated protein-domain-containing protein n=1 Tax=Zychaea mexicana TaxID=64656 RepID=UPI0022FE299D|nr:SIT4 phosphatase-associated protein-domain-containing protein [Zychaea mexicana]KAI9494474.1 SIT4 phosphatase-associated protein-domain-containing protein [Zychaea mexicana]